MTPTLIDHNETMYKYLTGCTALCTALGHTSTVQRIYGPPLGIPRNITEPLPLLLYSCDGGVGNPDIPMASLRFSFYLYGRTQAGARTIFRELFDVLHRKTRTDVTVSTGVKHLLSWGVLEAGPSDLPEPELLWPRVYCAFRVRFGEWVEAW